MASSPPSPPLPPPRIGVLELHGDFAEHTAMLRARGAATVPLRTAADVTADLDGVVLPGGESSTMAILLDALGMAAPLRAAIAAGLPAFGTCAGAILLSDEVVGKGGDAAAVALGGLDVATRRNGYGTQVHSFEAETAWLPADADGTAATAAAAAADATAAGAAAGGGGAVAPLPTGPLRVVLIRAPVFERLGGGVEVLVAHAGRAVLVRGGAQRQVLAATFHPELTGDGRVHALFLGMVDERRRRLAVGGGGGKPAVA